MYCKKCNMYRGMTKFCAYCGEALTDNYSQCPRCQKEYTANKYAYYCRWCGYQLKDIPLKEGEPDPTIEGPVFDTVEHGCGA